MQEWGFPQKCMDSFGGWFPFILPLNGGDFDRAFPNEASVTECQDLVFTCWPLPVMGSPSRNRGPEVHKRPRFLATDEHRIYRVRVLDDPGFRIR